MSFLRKKSPCLAAEYYVCIVLFKLLSKNGPVYKRPISWPRTEFICVMVLCTYLLNSKKVSDFFFSTKYFYISTTCWNTFAFQTYHHNLWCGNCWSVNQIISFMNSSSTTFNRALEVNGGIKIEIKIGKNNRIKYIHRIHRYDLNLI